jgi:hypothetical protein
MVGRLMLRVAFAAVIAFALTAVALASDDVPATPCFMTYERAKAIGESRSSAEDNTTFMDFSGADATALLKAINDMSPKSELTAERILVLERPDLNKVKLALISAGCVSHATTMSEQEWRKLRTQAFLGSRA